MKINRIIITVILCVACETEPPEPQRKRNEPVAHVTSLAASAVSNNSIEITWADVKGADKYIVQAKTGSGDFELVTDGILVEDDTDWSNENAAINVSQKTESVIFEGLTAGTTYDFIIHPYILEGDDDPAYKTNGKVPTKKTSTRNKPHKHVTSFEATTLSDTEVKVTWVDAPKVDKYVVLAKTEAGVFATLADGQLVADDTDWEDDNGALNVTQAVQELTFSGLTANTLYDFIIYPYNQGGTPDPEYKTKGNVPTASTSTTDEEVVEPPVHVTGFEADALSNTSVKVSWIDALGVDKYVVLAKTGAGDFATPTDGQLVADDTDWGDNNGALNVTQSVQELTFSGLTANTLYEFIIYPYNYGGTPDPNFKTDGTVPTASISTADEEVVEPPAHVTGFAAAALSNTSVKVSWEDASGADKYIVLAKTGAGDFATLADGQLLADDTDWGDHNGALNVTQAVQELIFSDLTSSTNYDFIIYPYNEGGDPDPNFKTDGSVPTASTSTEAEVMEPLAHVTGFAATALSNTSVKVSWEDASEVDKYIVLAKTAAGVFASIADGQYVADDSDWGDDNAALNVTQSVQELTFTGLTANTLYDFIIYPYNEGGDPDPNFKTDGSLPTANATTTNSGSPTFDESLVTVTVVSVSGTPFDITQFSEAANIHPQPDNVFSYVPQTVMSSRSDGSYAIAWHDASAKDIKITNVTSSDTKSGIDIVYGSDVHHLGGFSIKGDDYVIGSVTGMSKEKYSIALVDINGASSWTTDLTGTTDLATVGSKQSPMHFGSARIIVDATNQNIVSFISHEMMFPSSSIHQGGLFKFLDYQGTILGGMAPNGDDIAGGSNWLFSHNFDTRIALNNGLVAIVGNGDAIPRSVPIRIVNNSSIIQNNFLFEIDGNNGDNDTKTQLGGLIALSGNNFGLSFSSSVGRSARDVSFMSVGSDGNKIKQVWLTSYTATNAINVKSAQYGDDVLIAWEEVDNGNFKAMFAVVDVEGNIIETPQQFSNIRFNRGDDFINFANGDVGWAIGSGNQLKIYRLKIN